jgi:hypothetical protein
MSASTTAVLGSSASNAVVVATKVSRIFLTFLSVLRGR